MGKKKRDREERTGRIGGAADEAAEGGRKGKAKGPRSARREVWEYTKAIGSALIIALLLRQFLFQAFRIPTGSMLDTLQIGDFLFVNKFLYGAKTPERIRIPLVNWTLIDGLPVLQLPAIRQPRQGDIIVFEYPRDRNQDYIKRCVAVAGDTVRVRDAVLYVNGEVYESNFADRGGDHSCVPNWLDPESCLEPHTRRNPASLAARPHLRTWPGRGGDEFYVVPEGHIFMMGDNRFDSADSRYWGPLDVKKIRGKALFIYFSVKPEFPWVRFSRIGDLIR
jgi:signal peptidase I